MATIESIEGIGPANGKKLRAAGVQSVNALLQAGGAKSGRKALAKEIGIKESMILEWVNRADLMRIKGVSTQYSDLLEAAGVDTVKELRKRKPANLAAKMKEVNDSAIAKGSSIVRRPPSLSEVEKWVAQAKDMKPGVSY
jgi:predicted flap endonuclease-1-like 5' DNA nuclease